VDPATQQSFGPSTSVATAPTMNSVPVSYKAPSTKPLVGDTPLDHHAPYSLEKGRVQAVGHGRCNPSTSCSSFKRIRANRYPSNKGKAIVFCRSDQCRSSSLTGKYALSRPTNSSCAIFSPRDFVQHACPHVFQEAPEVMTRETAEVLGAQS